jgi:hypothetical protein
MAAAAEGRDAILRMGRVLHALERSIAGCKPRAASLMGTRLYTRRDRGGARLSSYPDHAR